MCLTDLPGYEANGVCCPLDCGQCEDSGCEDTSTDDNRWHCCPESVMNKGKLCSDTKEAPCIIGTGADERERRQGHKGTPEYLTMPGLLL